MDKEAEKTIGRLKEKIEATLDLFLRNRKQGTTTALKAAIAQADSPLLLSGNADHGKQLLNEADSEIEYLEVNGETISWNNIRSRMAKGRKGELIVDNNFMLRALDSIVSAFDFMWSEIQRLKKQNSDLREVNQNMKNKLNNALNETKELKENQKKMKKKMNKLKEKIDSFRNGRA